MGIAVRNLFCCPDLPMLVIYGQSGIAITPGSRNNTQIVGQIPSSNRFIVRDRAGLAGLNLTCLLLGCNILGNIADPNGQLLVVQNTGILNPDVFLTRLLSAVGVVDAELDQTVNAVGATLGDIPPYLTDESPFSITK